MLTDNVLDLIGNTPLIQLKGERIFAKAEFLNPGGSVKDRVALAMLEGAERDGQLKPDSIITSAPPCCNSPSAGSLPPLEHERLPGWRPCPSRDGKPRPCT
jgi:hypothetical protein